MSDAGRSPEVALGLLGRHVGRRAQDGAGGGERGVVALEPAGQAEVHDDQAAPGVDHDVGRLEVAVDDPLAVRLGQGHGQVAGRPRPPCRWSQGWSRSIVEASVPPSM